MAKELRQVVVGDRSYEIGQMNPFKSLRIFTRLTKMIAPSAGKALDGMSLDTEVGAEAFGKLLEALGDRLDENAMEQTVRELLENVMYEGRKVEPIVHFMGDVPHMLAVAAKVLEVEYGGFLPFVRSLLSSAREASGSASQSPQT